MHKITFMEGAVTDWAAEKEKNINRTVRRGDPEQALTTTILTREQAKANGLHPVAYYPHFARALGSVDAALILSQLQYWYTPDETGKPKITVDDHARVYWVAKSHAEWVEETGLTTKRVRVAVDLLIRRGIVEATTMRFNKQPTVHYRLVAADGKDRLDGILDVSEKPGVCPMGTPSAHWANAQQRLRRDHPKQNQKIQTSPDKTGLGHTTLDPKPDQAEPNPKTTNPENLQSGGKEGSANLTKSKGGPAEGFFYAALAETHDMDALLRACIGAGLVKPDRKMLCDRECRYLYPLDRQLAKSALDDSLETMLAACADWDAVSELIGSAYPEIHVSPRPNLAFLKKHCIKAVEAHLQRAMEAAAN